jgi:hypothetical protein
LRFFCADFMGKLEVAEDLEVYFIWNVIQLSFSDYTSWICA